MTFHTLVFNTGRQFVSSNCDRQIIIYIKKENTDDETMADSTPDEH
jgi:hypothetical protein